MDIQYLRHFDINKIKWDKCINHAVNGHVFANSWYLDIVSYQWEALVLGDYQAVMPLPIQRKLSINVLLQPQYAPQLGVYSTVKLSPNLVSAFINALPDKFKLVDLTLNAYNKTKEAKNHHKPTYSYSLDLIGPYNLLYRKFSKDVQDKIKEAKIIKMQVMRHLSLKDLLLLYQDSQSVPLTIEQLNMLRRIIPFSISNNIGEIYGTYNDKNQLTAAAYFIKSHNKVTCLLWAIISPDEQACALHSLFDWFIKENFEKPYTLEFCHTDQTWAELMYSGFGAKQIILPKVKYSRLPFLSKLI